MYIHFAMDKSCNLAEIIFSELAENPFVLLPKDITAQWLTNAGLLWHRANPLWKIGGKEEEEEEEEEGA